MLWVYDHYKYVNSYSAGIDFTRQTSKVDPRTTRVKPGSSDIIHSRMKLLNQKDKHTLNTVFK